MGHVVIWLRTFGRLTKSVSEGLLGPLCEKNTHWLSSNGLLAEAMKNQHLFTLNDLVFRMGSICCSEEP